MRSLDVCRESLSGKGADDENFPVGSFLLSKPHRRIVALYYRFARLSDDIADDASLSSTEKIARLDALELALQHDTDDDVGRLGALMRRRSIPIHHASDLLIAFRKDAVQSRYADWLELEDYCLHSAAPVGRFLLDLHQQDKALYTASDALCSALQVINHLQDCGDDYRHLSRVYLPLDICAACQADSANLAYARADKPLRCVFDAVLDGVERWLWQAKGLASAISVRRLGIEVAVIDRIAWRLLAELRHRNPLTERVELSRLAYGMCFLRAITAFCLRGGRAA